MSPSSILDGKKPYEMLFNVNPSYYHIRVLDVYAMFIIIDGQRVNLGSIVDDAFLLVTLVKRRDGKSMIYRMEAFL